MAAKPSPIPPPTTSVEFVYVVDGELAQRSYETASTTSVAEVIRALSAQLGRPELDVLYLEDDEKLLKSKDQIGKVLDGEFVVLHLGGKHDVEVEVAFNGRSKTTKFSPSATIRTVTAWAVSKKGLDLQGDASDFQLKLGNDLLPPDLHIGQVAVGREILRLSLVFKVKPQG